MLQHDRQQQILDYLEQFHSAKISELAAQLFTSESSVRRDVAQLESTGIVTRFHGGVILSQYRNDVVPADLRDSSNSARKEIIAQEAAKLIHDGDTIIFDSSSTVRRICKYIKGNKNVKIITNNIQICSELKGSDIKVYCTGGEFYQKRDCFLGAFAEEFLKSINADSVFFSCKGLSETGLITDVSEQEISMRKAMLKQAKNSYFLCDSSKLGNTYSFTVCDARNVTAILCDEEVPEFL